MTDGVDMVFYNAGCSTPCLASLTASSFPMMFVWGFDFADGNIVKVIFLAYLLFGLHGAYPCGYIGRMGFLCG